MWDTRSDHVYRWAASHMTSTKGSARMSAMHASSPASHAATASDVVAPSSAHCARM